MAKRRTLECSLGDATPPALYDQVGPLRTDKIVVENVRGRQSRDRPGGAIEARVGMERQSIITRPICNYAATETMAIDACQYIYVERCGYRMKPIRGKCCVFCSYGSVPCPPVQVRRPACR